MSKRVLDPFPAIAGRPPCVDVWVLGTTAGFLIFHGRRRNRIDIQMESIERVRFELAWIPADKKLDYTYLAEAACVL